MSIYNAEYYKNHKEQTIKAIRKWQKKNVDKIRKSKRNYMRRQKGTDKKKKWDKDYREKHKEELNKKSRMKWKIWYNIKTNKKKEYIRKKKYHKENKDKIKEWVKIWKQANKNKVSFYTLRRNNKKKNAEGSHTFGEWELLKKQYGYTCPCCGEKEPFNGRFKYLTEDHIIPLIKGGSDYIENIQPLCQSCNAKKHTKIIKY